MLPVDVAAGMRLKTIAGWNQTQADWHRFLELNPGGCFVALHQGRVVGTVTAIAYSGSVGWVGMMLVDPDFRRRGIGTRLMERAMASLHPSRPGDSWTPPLIFQNSFESLKPRSGISPKRLKQILRSIRWRRLVVHSFSVF